MKVVMIGTPVCYKCKNLKPLVEDYCSSHGGITFKYHDISDAPKEVLDIIINKNIKTAPILMIFREGKETVILSGDNVFMELESL